jgi:hypothetical protein
MEESKFDTNKPPDIGDHRSHDSQSCLLTSALSQGTSTSYEKTFGRTIVFCIVLAIGTIWVWFDESSGIWSVLGLAVLSSIGTTMKAKTFESPSFITILFILAAWGAHYWAFGIYDGGWFSRLFVVIISVMPIMAIANWLYRMDLASFQRERNQMADHFVRESHKPSARPKPFSLYLRPFSTTNRLASSALPNANNPPMPMNEAREFQQVDLESLVERALRPCTPLIGLGSDDDSHDGAGRVAVSDDDWKDIVSVLAKKATIRFIVPLDYPSTQWELKWLIDNDLVNGTLFLMPQPVMVQANGIWTPRDQGKKLFHSGFWSYDPKSQTMDVPGEWKRAMTAARKLGVRLPLMTSTGAMFTLDSQTFEPARIVPLGLSLMFGKLDYLRRIVPMLLRNSHHAVDRQETIRHFELGVGFKGNTRAFALIHAAHAYIIWGDVDQAIELLTRADAFAKNGRPSREVALQIPSQINAYLSEGYNETADMYRQSMDALLRNAGVDDQDQKKLSQSVMEDPRTSSEAIGISTL